MRRRAGIEPLGLVLSREKGLRVPGTIETSPVPARDWEAAVGSRIAARARPIRIDRGVLIVRAATSTWAQELSMLADAILEQLRGRGVRARSLRFVVGQVDAPERPPTRSEVRAAPGEVPLPATVAAVVQGVADPELRDAIAHAAARSLGWYARHEGAGTLGSTQGSTRESPRGSPQAPATSAPSAARGPRSAGTGSAPQGRTSRPSPPARRGKH